MLTLWENTAATVAQHAEFPGAARAFMAQPRVCSSISFSSFDSRVLSTLARSVTEAAMPTRRISKENPSDFSLEDDVTRRQ